MKRAYEVLRRTTPFSIMLIGVATVVSGCGTIDFNNFMAENACSILNCETLPFVEDIFAPPHDDMAGDHDNADADTDMAGDHEGMAGDHDNADADADMAGDHEGMAGDHDDMGDDDATDTESDDGGMHDGENEDSGGGSGMPE